MGTDAFPCISGIYLAFFLRIFMSLEPASHLPASGSFSLYILHLRYLTDL